MKEQTENSYNSSHMHEPMHIEFSFGPHTAQAWNELPESVVTLPLNHFNVVYYDYVMHSDKIL